MVFLTEKEEKTKLVGDERALSCPSGWALARSSARQVGIIIKVGKSGGACSALLPAMLLLLLARRRRRGDHARAISPSVRPRGREREGGREKGGERDTRRRHMQGREGKARTGQEYVHELGIKGEERI